MNETVYDQILAHTKCELTVLELMTKRLSEELPGMEPDIQLALCRALKPLRAATENAARLAAEQAEETVHKKTLDYR